MQNVGARVALNVLSSLSVRELERALALGDKAVIGRAQGVGPKLATRITTELKDKAPSMMARGARVVTNLVPKPAGPAPMRSSALVKLGYSQARRRKPWRGPRAIWAMGRRALIREVCGRWRAS